MTQLCPYCESKNVKVLGEKTLCKESHYPNRQIEITQQRWRCNDCRRTFSTKFAF